MTVADWIPTVDISETEIEYLIKAELPEVKKEDVKITLQEGVLTIQGERAQEREERGKRYHRVERAYGNFSRSFTLPDYVDDTKVTAEYKDQTSGEVRKAACEGPVTFGSVSERGLHQVPVPSPAQFIDNGPDYCHH